MYNLQFAAVYEVVTVMSVSVFIYIYRIMRQVTDAEDGSSEHGGRRVRVLILDMSSKLWLLIQ